MHSKAYIMGFLCGLLAVAIAVLIIRLVMKKKFGACKNEYDERQQAVQGKGYKYAYLTIMIVLLAGSIIEMMTGFSWSTLFPFTMLGVWISLCVFIGYCVIKDAYFSLRSRRKALIILFLIAGTFNLAISISNFAGGEGIITNGQLNYAFVNLLTGMCLILLSGVMIAKAISDRRQEDSE